MIVTSKPTERNFVLSIDVDNCTGLSEPLAFSTFSCLVFLVNSPLTCGESADMSYQDLTPQKGVFPSLATIKGQELIGCAVSSPLCKYPKIYCLPLMTIDMKKGTAVVTSVPSDAPDDFAALNDLKTKEPMRKKFGVADDMVLPFEVVPIIDIQGLGVSAAANMCKEMKVSSQNDRAKLDVIKQKVYLDGFYKGTLVVGPYSGRKVSEVKPIIRAELIKAGQAQAYFEPESEVLSRSGDICVVAYTDQWYLTYGEEKWRVRYLLFHSNHVSD